GQLDFQRKTDLRGAAHVVRIVPFLTLCQAKRLSMHAVPHRAGVWRPLAAFRVVQAGHRFRSNFQSLALGRFVHRGGQVECSPLPSWVRDSRYNDDQRIAGCLQAGQTLEQTARKNLQAQEKGGG
ncbi:hypothetical protein N9179_01390, partial [bacterium]|nr:hypothetical protein [bacterium]